MTRKIFRDRFQFIVTTRVYIFGKCLCHAFSSLRKIGHKSCYEFIKNKQTNKQTNKTKQKKTIHKQASKQTRTEVTNARWYTFFFVNK